MATDANPLFPSSDSDTGSPATPGGYVLPRQHHELRPGGHEPHGANQAADLIREKLRRIYAEEPDPLAEERTATVVRPRSRHQQFMYELTTSGKSLAEIQTAWHNYYVSLPDDQKHEVWQEFYTANGIARAQQGREMQPSSQAADTSRPAAVPFTPTAPAALGRQAGAPRQSSQVPAPQPGVTVSAMPPAEPAPQRRALPDWRGAAQIRQLIRDKVSAGGQLRVRHHLQSLAFGLGVGCITIVIFLFGFFNEVIIAPFIQPGRSAGATPIIVDPSTVTASTTPEIIIPKINLEIPADFSQTSTDENTIENALESGIVHYPSTVMPGQSGNAAFFGHSSNNIFNPGKYKFAFVLLHELVAGDTFYVTYNGKVYIYKVFSTEIVDPSDVGVLGNVPGHPATATLITCDPPGTSLHRLVVVGDQISPDPATNQGGSNTSSVSVTSAQLPGNGPSLLARLWNAIF